MKLIKKIISILNREVPIEYLIKRGMKVGKNFTKQQNCFIDPSYCFLIEIGNNVTFSIRVTLLAHDASCYKIVNYAKIGKIIIKDNVFIGANVTVLLNVKIGENSIVGAGSIVTKDVPPNCVVAGNPAKVIMTLEEYHDKLNSKMENSEILGKEYTSPRKGINKRKQEIIDKTDKYGIIFIK